MKTKGTLGLTQMVPILFIIAFAVIIMGLGGGVNQKFYDMTAAGDQLTRGAIGNGTQGILDASTLLPTVGILAVAIIIVGLVYLFKS